MLQKFKALISILGIVALILTTFSAISFADRGEREYRRGSNQGRYDNRFDHRDSHSRGDRDDRGERGDRGDRDDDDDVTAPAPLPPVFEPVPPVVEEPAPPVVEPTPPVVEEPAPPVVEEPAPPVVEPTPPVTEPTIDGSALYDRTCAPCHGQANKGRNIPSSHLSDPNRAGNLTQDQINAINAL